jgi:site-specific recombinase XerD
VPISPPAAVAADAQLVDAFRAHLIKRDRAPATVRVYLHDLRLFHKWLAGMSESPASSLAQAGTMNLATFRQHLLLDAFSEPIRPLIPA